MTIETEMSDSNPMKEMLGDLAPIKDAPLAPSHGIAAMALSMALKYHDIAIIKDGTMYQQYKLEGRNMREIHLDIVFETAMQMESWLIGSSDRIAKIVVDAINFEPGEEEAVDGTVEEEVAETRRTDLAG